MATNNCDSGKQGSVVVLLGENMAISNLLLVVRSSELGVVRGSELGVIINLCVFTPLWLLSVYW